MPIEIKLDADKFRKAMDASPVRLAFNIGRAELKFSTDFVRGFDKRRLKAPDDRNPNDFLQRRPASSQGLRRRTGSFARALTQKTKQAPRIEDVETVVGFTSPFAAMLANVHEFGKTIRPKRGPFLVIPIFSGVVTKAKKGKGRITTSRGTKPKYFVRVRKVTIPPRLNFYRDFFAPDNLKNLSDLLGRAIDKTLDAKETK